MCLMSNPLSHLNEKELSTLIERYYSGESVKTLLSEYNIDCLPSNLYKHFPPKAVPSEHCRYCDEILITNRKSRTYGDSFFKSDLYCPCCGHMPYALECKCENCISLKKVIQEHKKNLIFQCYSNKHKIEFNSLSFQNKIYLSALCRLLLEEDTETITPYSQKQLIQPLAPRMDMVGKIYDSLLKEKAIVVSPYSSVDAFAEENFPNSFYPYEVEYRLNILNSDITTMLHANYYDKENEHEQIVAYGLWKRIAVEDCISYLTYRLDELRFPFSPGEKTYKTFEEILESFSISQVYYFIYSAVKSAATYYQKGNISRQHAANTTINSCQRLAERALNENWNVDHYSRIKELPQSELATVLFNKILRIGNDGFDCIPFDIG